MMSSLKQVPPILKTPLEIYMNLNMHYNAEITDTSLPEDDRYGYSAGTNPTYRLLAEKLDIPDIGGVDVGSADVLRHGIRTFTGNLGEEVVLSTSDWIIDNFFLDYLLDPEVIEPYKMIAGMTDEIAQQKALSELDPIVREKVMIEIKRRHTKVPVFNKVTKTFYGDESSFGAEREIFPAVQRDFGIDVGKTEELDQEMAFHVNFVQTELFNISEQFERRQITPKEWRERRSDLFSQFKEHQDLEIAKLGDTVIFQNLTDEQQSEYWQRINDAMASRGFTNKSEYIYQQYQAIRIDTDLLDINEDLAFEKFFKQRSSYLDSLSESEVKQFNEKRDSRMNEVEREWTKESEVMQVLWDWTSRATIEKTLDTGKEVLWSAATLKSKKDLKGITLTKERRKVFEDYLLYINLEAMYQKDYRNPIVETTIKDEYAKLGLKYDETLVTDNLGRTVTKSHNAWIESVRAIIDEKNQYKTALKYNNPDIDKYYTKWFAYSPLNWSTAMRNLKGTGLEKTINKDIPKQGGKPIYTQLPVHETTQAMLKEYYPNVVQQGIE